jgi:hypothetical protein
MIFGRQAKAMAIMALWRMPPLYWCGKIIDPFQGDSYLGIQAAHAFARLSGACLRLVGGNRLHDLVADPLNGIERIHGRLKDHGDLFPADLPQCFRVGLEQIGAIEQDAAIGNVGIIRQQTHNGRADGRFAASRFTHHAQGLPFAQTEGDMVDGHYATIAAGTIGHTQIFDSEQ